VLVIAHRDRNLEVFVRVQAIGIDKMAFAQRAGVAQDAHHFIVSRQQVHKAARRVAFQRIEDTEGDLLGRGRELTDSGGMRVLECEFPGA